MNTGDIIHAVDGTEIKSMEAQSVSCSMLTKKVLTTFQTTIQNIVELLKNMIFNLCTVYTMLSQP